MSLSLGKRLSTGLPMGSVKPRKTSLGNCLLRGSRTEDVRPDKYLWHIIHNREQLADITMFVQGDFLKHGSISQIQAVSQNDPRPMAYLGVNITNDKPWPLSWATCTNSSTHILGMGNHPEADLLWLERSYGPEKSSSSLSPQRFIKSITRSGMKVTLLTYSRGLGTLFSEFIGELSREILRDKKLRLSAFRQPEGC